MGKFLIRRLLFSIPTLILIVTIAFFLIRIAPGGPFSREKGLSPTIQANIERVYGLDQTLPVQYLTYLGNLLKGDLGPSYYRTDFTVVELFRAGLHVSVQIGTITLIVALTLGIILGVLAALNQNRTVDYGVIALATIGSTIPTFVVAPIFQLVFALWLQWLPVAGWGDGALSNKIGPVFVLMLPQLAVFARLTRGSMIEALRAQHIRTARAMGLSDWSVVVKHALRGALIPLVSYLGPAATNLLTGSIVVETIFALPGIGRYFIEAALSRDYTVVMGTVIVVAVLIVAFNLIADVLYAIIDPRVRYD